jgi:multiple sugar transport system permease protein
VAAEASMTGGEVETASLRELWNQVPPHERRESERSRFLARALPYLLFLPAALVVLAVSAYPIIYGAQTSFQRYELLHKTNVGLENYKSLFSDSAFWSSLKTTCIYAGFGVGIELVLGLLLALMVYRSSGFARKLRVVYILPMVVAPIVVGIVWRLLYASQVGAVSKVGEFFGFSNVALLSHTATALPAVIAVDVWEWTPFMFLIILAGLQGLPSEPLEAAQVDGASRVRTFFTVTLPMLRPILGVALLIRLIDAFTTFDQIFVLTRGGPGTVTQLLSIYSYNTAFKFSQFGYAAAMVILQLILLLLIATAIIAYIRRDARAQGRSAV